ncbi:MAG: AAA family ATPase [Candidatus Thermoplasmatota archaeon]|nr:AAA family ATPase [Candidatus Thermoplasmatota archaeon]
MSTGELKRRISELTSDIAALGSVNHRAIEQYTTELNEVTLLRERMEELGKEKSSLEELMDQINNQKKLTFLELFDAVNKEINSIYYVLSDGGEAGLEITDRENPMEAEVYIKARPKGSNFSKIEALSGGEKSLTALAFIMSIQRINPSPVYYLDEVDMFLDGANAERVGRMFKENSRKSQIIAVSLRQAMLKYADNIIGVTTFDDENSEVFFKSFADKEKEESDEE